MSQCNLLQSGLYHAYTRISYVVPESVMDSAEIKFSVWQNTSQQPMSRTMKSREFYPNVYVLFDHFYLFTCLLNGSEALTCV
jgi:hypothetical protein